MPQIERLLPINYERATRRIITITGISGCGKDHLIEQAKRMDPDTTGNQVSVFNFGTELLRFISSQSPGLALPNRDFLKDLPQKEIEKYVRGTLELLISKQPALYLTHVVHRQQKELIISPEVERLINAREYIFIYTDPQLIFDWRQQCQVVRQREPQTVDDIALHQNIARVATYVFALSFGCGFLLIHNCPDGGLEGAAAILEDARKLLVSK